MTFFTKVWVPVVTFTKVSPQYPLLLSEMVPLPCAVPIKVPSKRYRLTCAGTSVVTSTPPFWISTFIRSLAICVSAMELKLEASNVARAELMTFPLLASIIMVTILQFLALLTCAGSLKVYSVVYSSPASTLGWIYPGVP